MALSLLPQQLSIAAHHSSFLEIQQRRLRPRGRLSLVIRAATEAQPAAASKSVPLLKQAARDKSVGAKDLALALIDLEKESKSKAGTPAPDETWLKTMGGTASPGKMWRLVFTSNGKMDPAKASGSYFPIPARQRFDAQAMEIENGVFFGPIGYLTFTGPFSFKSRRLSFLFHTLTLKLGPLPEFKFNIMPEKDKGRKPGEGAEGRKDPFFVWLYADEEVIAGRGRGGGVAFWEKYVGPPK